MTKYEDLKIGTTIHIPKSKKYGNKCNGISIESFLSMSVETKNNKYTTIGELTFLTIHDKLLYDKRNFLLKFKEHPLEWWQFAPDEIEIISDLCLIAKKAVKILDDKVYNKNFKYTPLRIKNKRSVFHIGNRWFTELDGETKSTVYPSLNTVYVINEKMNCLENKSLLAIIHERENPFIYETSDGNQCFVEIFLNDYYKISSKELHSILNIHPSIPIKITDE